jgi:hypothetical protein
LEGTQILIIETKLLLEGTQKLIIGRNKINIGP